MDFTLIDVQDTRCMMSRDAAVRRVGTRLVIVGTVHVDPASVRLAKEAVLDIRPEVVALELDPERLNALQNREAARPSISIGPSLFVMALLEKFAGQLTGSSPGLEMLGAVTAARSIGAKVELIDRPIRTTIAGLKKLPLEEKLRIGFDGLASIAFLPFGKADLSRFTEGIGNQLSVFRSRYPNLSKLLLDDREEYMATRIKAIMDQTTRQVMVIVGFGHLATLAKALEEHGDKPTYSTSVTWTLGS